MASVDNRVVEMGFDNAAFERKIATTMQSLDKLKNSLDFANSKKGLDELGKAGKSFSLEGMSSAIEGVSAKFLALSTIGITTLVNLTNRAVDAGIKLAKSLSLDQVISGFREYETNMNSIQTILANTESKGATLSTVNDALDELNRYADQTIYNFSEMTRNIGTFTAAGVDLDVSTQAIKGIANLAAISGSNSQQASTAMYQLSQALASGTVKLMDWNSVVNAGMGGEVFQKALFESGKALKTIDDIPLEMTFDQWKDAGNSFRGSLEQGWITAEVLTNTLQGFTGDLTEAQILSMGYTEEQTKAIMKMGQTGKDAATKVKTFTQLISTLQEAVGSGWATSFRILIGDFEQAKELFTNISNTLGEMIGKSADARNDVLSRWEIQGGRDELIKGLASAFQALMNVIAPIKEAFRTIFPPMTAYQLAELSRKFAEFMEQLVPTELQMYRMKRIFTGVFAAMEIGWTIIKETVGLFKDLFGALASGIGGDRDWIRYFGKIADSVVDLNQKLVAGGGIADFFDKVSKAITGFIDDPMKALNDLKDLFNEVFNILFKGDFTGMSFLEEDSAIVDFFFNIREAILGMFDGMPGVEGGFDRLEQRFEGLKKFTEVPPWLSKAGEDIKDIFSTLGELIGNWFSELGQKLAAAMGPGDFDAVLDALNVSLLGGIALLLKKFLDGGININFGGGIADSIKQTLGALTGQLEAMQANIKANALLKIAGAIAILTASVLVLSMIDSAALTKALTAMAVGFGQLIGAMQLMNQMAIGPRGAASMSTLAAGMVLLSGAVLLLSIAVKNLSGLNWEELAKGLTAVTVLLGVISGTAKLLQGSTGGLIRAGVGIIAIAVALNILAVAMKIFATMSWEEMGKGLTGVAGGLAAIVAAVNLLPKGMVAKGVGILAIAVGLNLLATAMKIIATMSWEEIAKGLAGVAGGLMAIALAMKLMPTKHMISMGVGLVLVGVSLNLLAKALESMSGMSWEEIGKGLATLGGSLLILAIAMHAMNGAVAGALALAIVASSLWLLAEVIGEFSKMSIGELVMGLAGFAGVLAVLGAASLIMAPIVPALLGLGIAMLTVGAGFALFGLGAQAVAKSFQILAEAGKAGVDVLMYAFEQLIMRLPEIATALGLAAIALAMTFLEAAPVIVEALGVLIQHILETVTKLAPEFATAAVALITELLATLRAVFPDIVATGFELLMELLRGIRDNMGEITTTVSEIIVNFLTALAGKMGDIVTAGVKVLVEFLAGLVENIGDVAEEAGNLIAAFITAIGGLHWKIIKAGTDVLVKMIEGIGNVMWRILKAGRDVVIEFIEGVGAMAADIVTAAVDTVIAFAEAVSDNAIRMATAAADIIIEFINELADVIREKSGELRDAGWELAKAIVSGMTLGLSDKAGEVAGAAGNLAKGAVGAAGKLVGWGSPAKVFVGMGKDIVRGLAIGLNDSDLVNTSAANLSNNLLGMFQNSLSKIPDAIKDIPEFAPTITPVLDLTNVRNGARNINGLLGGTSLAYQQARVISSATNDRADDLVAAGPVVPTEIKFEQNNYSPEALSTADIYRQTRNQIALAKEELAVL